MADGTRILEKDVKAAVKQTAKKSKRRPYEPPRLTPLSIGAIGKHQVHDVAAIATLDTGHDVRALMAEYGSPLFTISEERLRQDFRDFKKTFTLKGIETTVAYSYKTNYLPAVINILHDEGAWAEIVSGMEYELARVLGVKGRHIVFNGPHKTPEELEAAIGQDVLINIDSFDELKKVIAVAEGMNATARVGIRINFKYGTQPWTKFGFNHDDGSSFKALEKIAACPALKLEALHNHCGTFQLDTRIYARAAKVLIANAKKARDLGLAPEIADFGGGFPSANTLKPAWQPETGNVTSDGNHADFAAAILKPILEAKDLFGGKPRVILEPGRAIVDCCMQLACSVITRKELADGQMALIVDAGVNLLPTAAWYDHDVQPVSNEHTGGGLLQPTRIFGPLCMQIDVVRESAMMPALDPGDPVVIGNVGAYCLSQSMQFIQTRPAVVLLGEDGVDVIRRKETWRDVFALDDVPERLRRPGHAL